MQKNANIFFYLGATALFILLKFWLGTFGNNQLFFLLGPTNKIVEFVSGTDAIYSPGSGFFYGSLNVVIDKSCSGYNFLLLCYLMLFYLGVRHMKKASSKWLVFPAAFISAYILTLFINASRILVSVVLQPRIMALTNLPPGILHESIGVLTNLFFLIAIYTLVEKILIRKYAKLT